MVSDVGRVRYIKGEKGKRKGERGRRSEVDKNDGRGEMEKQGGKREREKWEERRPGEGINRCRGD